MRTVKFIATAALAIVMASCSSRPTVDYLPAKADGDSRWGLVDSRGEFLVADEFDERPSAVVNGMFFVEEGKGYTVYRAEKTPKQVGDLTGLKSVGYYTEGLMPIVRPEEHITFVDGNGKEKFVLEKVNDQEVKNCLNMFINGRCAIMTEDGKWGSIDTNGNVVIQPKYEYPPFFVDNVAMVHDTDANEWQIIDTNGNIKTTVDADLQYAEGSFIDGYASGRIGSDDSRRYVLISTSGEITELPKSVSDINGWNSRYVVFENESGDYGVMTHEGEVIVRAKYDGIAILTNGDFLGVLDDKYMLIDRSGEATRLPGKCATAIKYAYNFSKIFDFSFQLASENDDDIVKLCDFKGEKFGEKMSILRGRVEVYDLRSDFFDPEGMVKAFESMFDSEGLAGYPFGAMMSRFADTDSHTKDWYRGDYSISTDGPSTDYFTTSLVLRSNNTIVYDSTPYASYYTWDFNPNSRLDSFTMTISFNNSDDYRDELITRFAEALNNKFNINMAVLLPNEADTPMGYNESYISGNGYSSITLHMANPRVEEMCEPADSVAADSAAVAY